VRSWLTTGCEDELVVDLAVKHAAQVEYLVGNGPIDKQRKGRLPPSVKK